MTVLIAAGTWIVTQAQARRAARRDMRVTYLLDAYRRLDRASNRPLAPTSAHDIEAAISDIILLGTATQVSLADEFARAFAAEHSAESHRPPARPPHLPPPRTPPRRTTGLPIHHPAHQRRKRQASTVCAATQNPVSPSAPTHSEQPRNDPPNTSPFRATAKSLGSRTYPPLTRRPNAQSAHRRHTRAEPRVRPLHGPNGGQAPPCLWVCGWGRRFRCSRSHPHPKGPRR